MNADPPSGTLPIFKMWWPNPIFRRYARSRLRPQALGTALLLTVMIAGFMFFMFRTTSRYQGGMVTVDAERLVLVPLLVLQAIILFFLGTGQVAAGITADADEGTLDYQRLAPLTPANKVIGYLFGLPVREWCMFAATLPFTAWALWKGEVPAVTWMSIYGAFLSSALLYHLTGLVAGTVLKNRRWAFLVSIGVIFLLYTVIPQAAKFGLVYFKYLTLWPVVDENMMDFLPREAGGMMRFARSLQPDVRFFGLHFSEVTFTLFSQGILILTFFVMVWRRWRRSESHLMGKAWALGLFVWMQLQLLGNALPLIEPGLLFPTRQFRGMMSRVGGDWAPEAWEAVAMIGVYGLVNVLLLSVLTGIITPTHENQIRGLQRVRKLGWTRVPRFSDEASSIIFVLLMAIAGTVGWGIFSQALISSHWFAGYSLKPYAWGAFALVMLGGGLCRQAVVEGWGSRRYFLMSIFLAILPLMVGGILMPIGPLSRTAAIWVAGISPLSAPAYAAVTLVQGVDLPVVIERSMPKAFWFWQVIWGLYTLWAIAALRTAHRRKAAMVAAGNLLAG
ncbi:MAG: hypothetical protein JWL81_3237 [Verrucomicrobiales bacterium]|nr:hypothetical protein [Verrucomicrobiales bacterium]